MQGSDNRLKSRGSQEQAATLALHVLEYLAADDDRLAVLMSATGLTAQDLRSNAENPIFLGGILDYLLSSETLVLEWAATSGFPPETVARARQHLPGGFDAA